MPLLLYTHTIPSMKRKWRVALLLLIAFVWAVPPVSALEDFCRVYQEGCFFYFEVHEGYETISWECYNGDSGATYTADGTYAQKCRIIG